MGSRSRRGLVTLSMLKQLGVLVFASLFVPAVASAQQPAAAANPTTICGSPIPRPAALPPAGSGPVIFLIAPCFAAQGNVNLVDIQTYLYYIQLKSSRPSQGVWVPYNDDSEKAILDDFKRLWGTEFLDNLSIETQDYTFSNGVVGKLIVYNIEERQRVKNVDYVGSKKLERSKIEEKLKTTNTVIRLDTFIDPVAHSEGRRPRARHDEGKGLSGRRGDARDHPGHRRSRNRSTSCSTCRRARRSRFGPSISPGTRRFPTARCGAG